MMDLFFSQKIAKFSVSFLLATAIAVLAGCSDNTASIGTGPGPGPGTTTTGPSLIVSLASNSISSGTSTTANATVKDATGAAVPNTVVTFSTDATMATMTPSSGTALTNGSGVASITLTGGANQGATTISATAQVGTTAVTGSSGYTVGAVAVTISAPVFGVGATPLSAFGTTSVTATVTGGGGSSQTVNFSSICSSSGKAVLSTGIATVAGVATASYRDNGCASTDTITVTVSGGLATNSANLVVTPPTTGSIQYVSSVPTNISLKGTGGTEVSQVTFKVLDTGGNPLSGKLVTFGLSTTVGGIILTPNTGAPFNVGTATSDANGLVVTNVNAGTVSTPVRVTAATTGAGAISLTTQSSQLTITTGIPDQFGISLVATTHNIEGWNYDGTTSVLTTRLADHFKNPVPDGTAVVFTAEAGTVVGSCNTVGGACSATYTSSGTRPDNGRATVLTYAVGEETFTDLNGNGWADVVLSPTVLKNEMIDPNGNATDLPEAWVDYNEDGIYDAATEPYIDFNQDGIYNPADGKFNGVLCDDVTPGRSSTGSCSTTHTLHVRDSQVMILSSSHANVTINGGATATAKTTSGSTSLATVSVSTGTLAVGQVLTGTGIPAGTTIVSIALPAVVMSAAATASGSGVVVTATGSPIDPIVLPPCDLVLGDVPATFIVTVVDVNGNAMPAGTTVAFSPDNGTLTSAASYIVPDTIGCRSSTHLVAGVPVPDYLDCPASAGSATFGDIPVTMKSDATFTVVLPAGPNTCSNSTPSGTFTVKVTSPKGLITTATATVTD